MPIRFPYICGNKKLLEAMNIFQDYPHRRHNPLTDEWVLVSPQRSKRPWLGQVEAVSTEIKPSYDPACYLCPGNKRINGELNPQYPSAFPFTNDFGALMAEVEDTQVEDGLFKMQTERGISRVICFSPDHSKTIPTMSVSEIADVVALWVEEFKTLGSLPYINYVQIFENKGAVMGCSNPHPHGQIWAQQNIPVEPYKKQVNQLKYYEKHGKTLLSDYVESELEKKERVIFENKHFVCLVPFWAVWPYETMIVPKRAIADILQFTKEEQEAFADAYRTITVIYDKLFNTSFPYSAGIHQAPTDGLTHNEWHLHMVFYPPLLRSASVKKFMVGYEMLANPQRDITPEWSAAKLRELL